MAAVLLVTAGLYAQAADAEGAGFEIGGGVSLGVDNIPNADGTNTSWNVLGFQPDLAIGNFGIGLDLTLRFQIMPDQNTPFAVYLGDWLPNYEENGRNILDIYLPKIQFVRYGYQGDPLYVKLGSIEDLTLGTGFMMGNYANTRFLPEQRLFGASFRLDGSLFNFPWVGIEALTGNLARLDVIGARLFARPLISLELPIIKNVQIGGSFITDRDPALYRPDIVTTLDPIFIYSADVMLPILGGDLFPLAAFTEVAFEPNGSTGFMVGAGGRLVKFITYGAQLRLLQAGFMPNYFDPNYDLYRAEKALVMQAAISGEDSAAWFASLGTSLFEDKVVFNVNMAGTFAANPDPRSDNPALYPHIRAVAILEEGLVGGFSFEASYDKYFLGRDRNFFADLIDPNDAIITAAINYSTGGAMFTLLYNLTYNPELAGPNMFEITSSLSTSIRF
ncbi:MAG: hypothetical protein A2087_11790 [Spirochaetes bacterium GWD1_61_31]|nr:MAG: hypothetical protein A2Y37_04665 [Spirochaetes bacterium GWB1_60_80]OHD34778.1 MAG: hypothetical protein A2004_08660 [Spirochaetes bacterium GWC1_61_12]OHD41716.1 MAG: hypothetical protein A2087_11790 [Spirochaetes bacterium GWD1_61_31]OHD44618.1 MAG: hypothetical protein A2Y35_12025 [Spirochaetes bacterium GWE1_60_18]HAP43931.1 hypothetical protein [Spirochaetaceae bacterium]